MYVTWPIDAVFALTDEEYMAFMLSDGSLESFLRVVKPSLFI